MKLWVRQIQRRGFQNSIKGAGLTSLGTKRLNFEAQ